MLRLKEHFNAWLAVRSLLVEVLFVIIRRFMKKHSNVRFAWSVLQVNNILIGTIEHIQVRNLMCVLLVIKDLLKSLIYKAIREVTVMREILNAWSAPTKGVLKLKMNWLHTWCIIMNQNSLVQNVVRSCILQVIWTNM